MRLQPPIICIVTRGRGVSGSTERGVLLERLAAGAAAGASMIQIRERQFDDRQLVTFVREVKQAVEPTGTRVIVNDRADIAIAADADGVHLKGDAAPAADVRRILPDRYLLGRSVHSVDDARAAADGGGCDYLFFGTVYPSSSKPDHHRISGPSELAAVCRAVSLPVVAIGGITAPRAHEAFAAGAGGVAAISFFAESRDVGGAVHALRGALTLPRGNVYIGGDHE